MTPEQFFKSVIGRPYALGELGPDAFDCWGLVRHYYRTMRGMDLPVVDAERTLAIARAFSNNAERDNWVEVWHPAEGDAVLMGQARRPHHVGLWLGGGVLHAVEGAGVIYTTAPMLRFGGWNVIGYYRHT
ncbi:MAG: NlpC/P60 family protein [Thiobacillus sp.]|uniref:NlpC/P60 family protein n=1 Tax=Thiobacillus sp. TaxID=924 RepID=UPI00289461D7|nr:NlpC/P60 family protein [Thiobacillus sp.]MDT3708178.1 NlpC/P60 family protein [Thiobacillus sp.]